MSLVPKEKPAKIGVGGGGAFSILSIDKYKNPDKILVLGGGSSSVVAIDDVTRYSFAVLGGGASSKVSVEYVEGADEGVVVPLGIHYEMEPLVNAQLPLPVAFWYFVPVPDHVRHSCAWKMWIPTTAYAHMTVSCFYALDVAYHYPQFSCSVGLLTQKFRKTFLHWKMGQLKTDLSAKVHLNNTMYAVTITKGLLQSSYEFRNWDKTDLCLDFGMGQNYQTKGKVSLANTTGVIEQKDVRITLANTTGKNHLLYSGFGAEYKAESNNEPVYGQVTLGYQVNSFEGVGFEPVQFTLGWAQEATAEETEFGLYYAQTYLAYSEMRLAYARHFSVEFIRFSMYSVKERYLTVGVTIPTPFSVMAGVTLRYSLNEKLVFGQPVAVPLNQVVVGAVEVTLALSRVFNKAEVTLPIRNVLTLGVELPMTSTEDVRFGSTIEAPLRETLVAGKSLVYSLLSYTPVQKGFILPAQLSDFTPLVRDTPFTIEDPTGIDTDGLDLTSASIVADEGSYGWVGTFEMADLLDLRKFKANSLFSFVLGNDTYVFMVDAKNIDRPEPTKLKATLKGVSPAVQLTAPRASTITKTWTSPVMAHDLINEVAGGYPVQIEILNWAIPANRYGVSDMSPMDIIKQVAAAVGGVVDSLPSGELRVRYSFPTPVTSWAAGYADHQYDETDDIISSKDEDVPLRVFDKFRVMDNQTASGEDKLEYSESTSSTGEVRASPSPWRATVTLESSSSTAGIGSSSVEYREEEETIEIFNGEGSTRYPVSSVTSIQWLGTNLLGVVAGNDSTTVTSTHTIEKFSLLKIKYQTRCLVFPVSGIIGEQAQFLLKD